MNARISRALALFLALAAIAGSARAGNSLWLHVTVDESGGAKVTVNLPLALAEKALPLIPFEEKMRWDRHEHLGMELAELRSLWAEVKNSPDMTFVTVEEDSERVKVWKEKSFVYVEVRGDEGDEQVDVQVPMEVVDALVGGEKIDFAAAIQALAARGGGELVSVRDRADQVRVWIDETPEARQSGP